MDNFFDEQNIDIFEAIDEGNLPLVRSIIVDKSKVNMKNIDGQTPLILAAKRNDLRIVKLLLNNGANLEMMDTSQKSALEYALESGYEDIKQVFEDWSSKDSISAEQVSPLAQANGK